MSYINPDLAKASISLAAGVFTVTMPSPCKVVLPSTTAGENVTVDISGNTYTFDDVNGTSNLTGLTFGITSGADWAQDMPLIMYLVNQDNTGANVGCFFSRLPNLIVTPADGYIHDKTAAAAGDDQTSIFGMWAGTESAAMAAKPCLPIGTFRMRYASGTTDWTVQTIGNTDGIGQDRLDKTFATIWTMAAGQMGAASGKYMWDNGGTAPTFTNNQVFYTISRDGMCMMVIDVNGNTATDGVGAVGAAFAIPFTPSSADTYYKDLLRIKAPGASMATDQFCIAAFNSANSYIAFLQADGSAIYNGDFTDGSRVINGGVTYKVGT